MPTLGRFWIQAATGRVLATELLIDDAVLNVVIHVRYQPDAESETACTDPLPACAVSTTIRSAGVNRGSDIRPVFDAAGVLPFTAESLDAVQRPGRQGRPEPASRPAAAHHSVLLANGGASLEAAPLVRRIAVSAYRAGAPLVEVLWGDEALLLLRFQHAPRESFATVLGAGCPRTLLEHVRARPRGAVGLRERSRST